jgi:hypothetical protein
MLDPVLGGLPLEPRRQLLDADVEVDGRLVFSKWETHRFPEEDEILNAL